MTDPRDAVWDEPTGPSPCAGLQIRALSINAIRRATRLGLVLITHGPGQATRSLLPVDYRAQLETIAWLLAAPLEEVKAALRSGADPEALAVDIPDPVAFNREITRQVCLLKSCLFGLEKKPAEPGLAAPAVCPVPEFPPAAQATLIFAVAKHCHMSPDEIAEHRPAAQIYQLMHCFQSTSPDFWTIHPAGPKHSAALEVELPEDEGFGETVEF